MTAVAVHSSRPSLQRKRVIFVFNNLDLGGAERQGLLLATHLQKSERALVEVWGFDGPGRVAQLCDEADLPWRVVPCRWGQSRLGLPAQLFRFALHLRKARPDVLLPYIFGPNLVCGAVWRWAGASFCLWQQRDEGLGAGRGRAARWAARRTLQFAANSAASAAFLTKVLRVPETRVRIIHNGVVLPPPLEARSSWRNRLRISAPSCVACMVANLHSQKDHSTLLRAWRLVLDRMKEAWPALVLAGRFDDRASALKALAGELELGSSVQFLGPVEDISGLLGAVDLGVHSSRTEGCPNGVLECMASGLAVAGTDIPGIREAVGEGGLPFLAPPGDVQRLAQCISTLLADPALRARHGELNQDRITREFSPARMCDETVKLILAGLN